MTQRSFLPNPEIAEQFASDQRVVMQCSDVTAFLRTLPEEWLSHKAEGSTIDRHQEVLS